MFGLTILDICLIITSIVFLILFILVFLMYKEAKLNVIDINAECEVERADFLRQIEEKDNELSKFKGFGSSFIPQKEEKPIENKPEVIDNSREYEEKIKEKDALIDKRNKELEDYKKLSTSLIKDFYDLEDKYIKLGGNLNDLYDDYNEYY